jgi:hypothetical protein
MTTTPADPTPPVEPTGATAAAPTPAVPYGPPLGESDSSVPGAGVTIDLSTRSVAGTAGKWALRLLVPLLIRAIFRAIFR